MSTISHKLKLLRQRESLSQKALADLTGISQGAIGDIESGRKKNLSGDSLSKLCNHPRFRRYALWLISNPSTEVSEPDQSYALTNAGEMLKRLTPPQRDQVVAFIQLLQEQSTPD